MGKEIHENNSKCDTGKERDTMDAVIKRYCTVSESLEESLKQMKAMRKSKVKPQTWDEYLKDLQDSKGNDK